MLAGAFTQDFDRPTFGLGIAGVHAEQIAGEQCRLIAAGSGADFQKDIAVVMRILRNQQALQLELFAQDAGVQLRKFLLAQILGGGIGILGQFMRDCGVSLERDETAIAIDQGSQARVFHRQFAKLVLTPDDARIRQQAADFLEALVKFFQLAPDRIFHGRELSRPWSQCESRSAVKSLVTVSANAKSASSEAWRKACVGACSSRFVRVVARNSMTSSLDLPAASMRRACSTDSLRIPSACSRSARMAGAASCARASARNFATSSFMTRRAPLAACSRCCRFSSTSCCRSSMEKR